jgi:hypothetical protein
MVKITLSANTEEANDPSPDQATQEPKAIFPGTFHSPAKEITGGIALPKFQWQKATEYRTLQTE